jgi:hypothetical protein
VSTAFETLIEAVDAGTPVRETRIEFARALNRAERDDDALSSVAAVLAEEPDDPEALALRAHVLASAGRFDAAERLVAAVLARTPLDTQTGAEAAEVMTDAWGVLRDTYRAQGLWAALEAAATEALDGALPRGERARVYLDRARARIELGSFAAAEADLSALGQPTVLLLRRRIGVLRALALLRQARYQAALAAALELIRSVPYASWLEPELPAIRCEAAHALGLRRDAGVLRAADVARLRRIGYAA